MKRISSKRLKGADVIMSGDEMAVDGRRVFAVYSKDDKSLRFYNREAMPEIGEVFEGRTADAVYADVLEPGAYSRIWSDQDRDIADVEFVDEGIGDLLLEKEVESRKLADSGEGAHASIWVRTLAGVLGGLLLGSLVGTVLQCLR